MRPQLLIVEMLLADANARFTAGEIDTACRDIEQAAVLMEGLTTPAELAAFAPAAEATAVAEVVAAAHISPVLQIPVEQLSQEELSQIAEVAAVVGNGALEIAPVAVPPALAHKEERPRAMAAAA